MILPLRLTICGICTTLIFSQFPAPLSHIGIALLNYILIVIGQGSTRRHVTMNSLWKTAQSFPPHQQYNAITAGLIVGGISVLPGGWLWSSIASGVLGYHTSEILAI